MLLQRILSALILIPIIFAAIWFSELWFTILVAVVALLGSWEFHNLAPFNWMPLTILGLLCSLLIILDAYFGGEYTTPVLLSALVLPLIISLIFPQRRREAFTMWTWTTCGILYVGLLLSYYVMTRGLAYGREWVILAIFATFATDTCAFFIGRALGRHPLAPMLSPGKTWEGAAGGLLGAIAAVLALTFILGLPVGTGYMILLGALIGVFAQLGDLVESMLKRTAGAKDSGRLIPGHGGILDRLDSIVFTGVVVYYYVVWVIA